jgi:hypothetical protein
MDYIEKMIREKFKDGYREVIEQYKIRCFQELDDSIKNDSVEEIGQFVDAIIYVLEDAVRDEEIIAAFKQAGKEEVGRSIIEKIRDVGRIDRILSQIREILYMTPNTQFFHVIEQLKQEYSKQNNDYGKRNVIEADEEGYIQARFSITDFNELADKRFEKFLLDYQSKENGEKE